MLRQSKSALALAVLALTASASQALAAGFEKSIFWSGHYGGIAGAAQSIVTGPEALFFNPAGLAGSEGLQLAGDISPTVSQFKGPFNASVGQASSNTSVSIPGAAFVSAGLSPQWGVGIGYYVSLANKADYDTVNLGIPGLSFNPNIRGDLTVTELSIGTGYEIIPGLKLGAAYRIMFVSGELAAAGAPFSTGGANVGIVYFDANNISKTAWSGFRVGLEYAPKDSAFGFGLVYRNQVRFVADSSASVTNASTNGLAGAPGGTNSGGGTPQISGTLPQRLDAAMHYHFNPEWTGFLGYNFINYSVERQIGVSGLLVNGSPVQANIPLSWTNQHSVRVAGEYTGLAEWPLRAGFVWVSEVTPKGNALPIVAAPGTGYTITVGSGHKLMSNLSIDGAFDYSWDAGTVAASDNPTGTTQTGDYSAHAFAFHLGATYVF